MLVWLIAVVFVIAKYYNVSGNDIILFIKKYKSAAVIVFLVLSSIRGLFFLPSTPFVFASLSIFPKSKILALAISLASIFISATLIYLFAEYLDISKLFKAKDRENKIKNIREKLTSSKGFLFIALWAFLPFAPTDLVSYVAGTVKMNYMRFITATMAGEAIVCTIYIYAGHNIWQLLMHRS